MAKILKFPQVAERATEPDERRELRYRAMIAQLDRMLAEAVARELADAPVEGA